MKFNANCANYANLADLICENGHDEILQNIPECDREIKTERLIEFDKTIKSLGIHWHPATDKFVFQYSPEKISTTITKRTVLSDISKLFDPLGWLCPIIIRAKMFIQKLWLQDLEWDDELSPSQLKEWTEIHNTITFVKDISIPRAISYNENFHIELHDASINAFAAVVYSRVTQPDGTHKINLLTAMSRVAPIKQLTIAKLELAGAHLLSKLLSITLSELKINGIFTEAARHYSSRFHAYRRRQCRSNRHSNVERTRRKIL